MEDALFEFKVSRTYQGAIEGRGIKNPADLIAFFYERVYRKIDAWQRENFVAVYLDAGNHILGWELLSIGTSCSCLVDIKGIIRSACLTGAASVALAHNHPSLGDCRPSKADIEEASRLQTILKSAGITLLDFVILTQNGFGYTFSEERVIKCEISPENGQEKWDGYTPQEAAERLHRYLLQWHRINLRGFIKARLASDEQPELPNNEREGIPGKDYIPVEWVDACERYGKWRIIKQEHPEVDLEKEIKNYLATKCAGDDEPSVSEIARHFYELGLNARKEK